MSDMLGTARDAEGLTYRQRRFLTTLAATGNWAAACAAADVTSRTARRWLGGDLHFKAAYDAQFATTNEQLVDLLDAAGEKAMSTLAEALGAEGGRTVEIDCPHADCSKRHKVRVPVENWRTRLAAVDRILKVKGLMIEKRETKVSGQVEHLHLTAEDKLALARWRHGYEIPEHLSQKFREMQAQGLLEAPRDEPIEGEVKEVADEVDS